MKPLKFKGIPQKESYEEMTLAEQVKIGVAFEAMLKKAYHEEVEKHLNHLKTIALDETRYHLVQLVEKTGRAKGLDYRESILWFNEEFKKVHPRKMFFTEALTEDGFSNIVEVKKLSLSLVSELKKTA